MSSLKKDLPRKSVSKEEDPLLCPSKPKTPNLSEEDRKLWLAIKDLEEHLDGFTGVDSRF